MHRNESTTKIEQKKDQHYMFALTQTTFRPHCNAKAYHKLYFIQKYFYRSHSQAQPFEESEQSNAKPDSSGLLNSLLKCDRTLKRGQITPSSESQRDPGIVPESNAPPVILKEIKDPLAAKSLSSAGMLPLRPLSSKLIQREVFSKPS